MKRVIPELISRLTIGLVFIESGWGKLHNLPKVVEFFESLNIPYANLQAPFVGTLELVAGALILFGLMTRLSSLTLIPIMAVALATAKRDDITDLSSLFGLSEFLYIVILVWLSIYGSEFLSVDALICRFAKNGACKKRAFATKFAVKFADEKNAVEQNRY